MNLILATWVKKLLLMPPPFYKKMVAYVKKKKGGGGELILATWVKAFKQAICGGVSKPEGFFNFHVTSYPFRI